MTLLIDNRSDSYHFEAGDMVVGRISKRGDDASMASLRASHFHLGERYAGLVRCTS